MPDVLSLLRFAEHPDEVGPKLRCLGALAGWGYRVPDGFAVTRSAVEELNRSSASEPFSMRVGKAVEREYDALCARLGRRQPALAVRSAVTGEDGELRSFAGMYETVLGVLGLDQLQEAILTCVRSLRGQRVEQYSGSGECGAMTVGVQELVDARASGVGFSRHPVTHRDDRLVIEGVFGLGVGLVDGLAQPDHIEVGRADGRVLRYAVGDKQKRVVPAERGGVRVEDTPAAQRREPCLSAGEIAPLCRAMLEIEERFGRAVDIEWVIDGDGALVIVQARPITSGPRDAPEPVQWDPVRYARRPGARRER